MPPSEPQPGFGGGVPYVLVVVASTLIDEPPPQTTFGERKLIISSTRAMWSLRLDMPRPVTTATISPSSLTTAPPVSSVSLAEMSV